MLFSGLNGAEQVAGFETATARGRVVSSAVQSNAGLTELTRAYADSKENNKSKRKAPQC